MERLLYVSKSNIKEIDVLAVVSHVVAKAAEWNIDHDLTGALIFTGTHFAQVLEGSPKDIDDVMVIITMTPDMAQFRSLTGHLSLNDSFHTGQWLIRGHRNLFPVM